MPLKLFTRTLRIPHSGEVILAASIYKTVADFKSCLGGSPDFVGLRDLKGVEVHMIVRYHFEPSEDLDRLKEQVSMLNAACEDLDPISPSIVPGRCPDVQFTVFLPEENGDDGANEMSAFHSENDVFWNDNPENLRAAGFNPDLAGERVRRSNAMLWRTDESLSVVVKTRLKD